jgi:thiamine kinase-like enzyme
MYLLNTYNLFHYMVGRNGPGSMPKLVCTNAQSSNQYGLFNVQWSDGKRWFIKQPYQLLDNLRFNITNEAEVVRKISGINQLTCYSPGYIDYDLKHKILINDHFFDYVNLFQNIEVSISKLLTDGNLPEKIAVMLASFHTHLTQSVITTFNKASFYAFRPPLLVDNIAFLNPLLQNETIPFIKRKWLFALVSQQRVVDTLLELNHIWRPNYVIHGDAVFSNILIQLNGSSIDKIKLCDWEYAGWGDPDWDTACFFQGLLNAYIEKRINHDIIVTTAERYYYAYRSLQQHTYQILPFEKWFIKILQLAAVCYLERLLGGDTTTDNSDIILNDTVEFLLTCVLINPKLLKSF